MTRWEVVASRADAWGQGQTWTVVKVTPNSRESVRTRWENLSCIDAQVIAAELNNAHELGGNETRANIYSILSD